MASSTIPNGVGYDYIISEGTSGSWKFRKWKSGKVEAWATFSGSVACTTTSAAYGGYRSANVYYSLPQGIFPSTPQLIASKSIGGSIILGHARATAGYGTNAIETMYRSAESTTQTVNINFYAFYI